jgi:cell division protein ZapA (FtsZ GTPase activity inhibitor)
MKIVIRNHSFNVSCQPQDEAIMREAAAELENSLYAAREQHSIADSERSAIVAGLMVAFSHKKAHNEPNSDDKAQTAEGRAESQPILNAIARIDAVLHKTGSSAKD